MGDNTKTLQKLINEKAEGRFQHDLNEYLRHVQNHKFFTAIDHLKMEDGSNFWEQIRYPTKELQTRIRQVYLPKYIEQESRKIFNKLNKEQE